MNNDTGIGTFTPSFVIPGNPTTIDNSSTSSKKTVPPDTSAYTNWIITGFTVALVILFIVFMYLFGYDSSTDTSKNTPILMKESERLLSQLTTYLTSPQYSDPVESI